MKTLYRLFLLLAVLLPSVAFTSCDDENSFPDVDFSVTFDNAVYSNGILYVVEGEQFDITSIDVTNREAGKNAAITAANYYWDFEYIGSSVRPPYNFSIKLSPGTTAGRHNLQIECPVIAADKTPATATVVLDVLVVPSSNDMPNVDTENSLKVIPDISNTDK